MPVEPRPSGRVTQQQRSEAMRERLLSSCVEALAEIGYHGTTTLEVQARAGVSRGALLHHYSSRDELMVAAVEHVTSQHRDHLAELASRVPPDGARIEWAVRTLWGSFQGPLFKASMELILAARHDPQLREVLRPRERQLARAITDMAASVFGPSSEHPDFFAFLEILLDAMRGAATLSLLRGHGRDERLIAEWTHLAQWRLQQALQP